MPNYKPVSETDMNSPDEEVSSNTQDYTTTATDDETELTESETNDADDDSGTVNEDRDRSSGSNVEYANERHNQKDDFKSKSKDGKRKRRAELARDLVQNQENLILMLQRMKTDLSKMDREATSIKEDVVRSRQLFDVVVANKRIHHLNYSANGYNLSYAMPKVSYSNYKRRSEDTVNDYRHLSRLSTFTGVSSLDMSRRTSLSSRRSSMQNDIDYFRPRFRHSGRRKSSSSQCVTSQSEYSETDSEYDSERAPVWSRDVTRNDIAVSGMSTDSCVSDSSVCDSSTDSKTREMSEYRLKNTKRRSSYFFTRKTESPQPELSDDVCV